MTTARQIITSALTLRLNRLSPGETLDADLATLGLVALNEIGDDWSGMAFLAYREVLAASATPITGITGTLGTTWTQIDPGQDIEDANYNNGQFDYPMAQLTMEQYQNQIPLKNLAGGLPQYWAYDGDSTVYFYPACTGQIITLRAKLSLSNFADLDTNYVFPQGYASALADAVAERMALALLGSVPPGIQRAAAMSRARIATMNTEPAIISGKGVRGNIFSGFR